MGSLWLHDGVMGPMRGIDGTSDAECDVQRNIKRAELTAILCLLTRMVGPTSAHVAYRGIISTGAVEKKNEVHLSENEGCGSVDSDVGRNTHAPPRRNFFGSRACQSAQVEEEQAQNVAVRALCC